MTLRQVCTKSIGSSPPVERTLAFMAWLDCPIADSLCLQQSVHDEIFADDALWLSAFSHDSWTCELPFAGDEPSDERYKHNCFNRS